MQTVNDKMQINLVWKQNEFINAHANTERGLTMQNPLRIGVIGLGLIGGLHARIVHECPNAVLAAVTDINEGAARAAAERYGCQWYADFRRMCRSGCRLHLHARSIPSGKRAVRGQKGTAPFD